jgi:hypothetical protein
MFYINFVVVFDCVYTQLVRNVKLHKKKRSVSILLSEIDLNGTQTQSPLTEGLNTIRLHYKRQ